MDGRPENPSTIYLLRCSECGATAECNPADLIHFTQTKKWPRCCGHVMTLFLPAPPDALPPG
jgi:hypothetical protein